MGLQRCCWHTLFQNGQPHISDWLYRKRDKRLAGRLDDSISAVGCLMLRILVFVVLFSGCAADSSWSRKDTTWEVAYQLVNAVDAVTTSRIQQHQDIIEGGWPTAAILGRNPGASDTAVLFMTYGISHYLIVRALPGRWRRSYQAITLGVSSWSVVVNCRNGLC